MSADKATELQQRFDKVRECAQQYQEIVNKLLQDSRAHLQLAEGELDSDPTTDSIFARTEKAEKRVQDLEQENAILRKYAVNALHLAARQGDSGGVSVLLRGRSNPETTDSNGDYPLHLAAATGNLDVVKALVQNGANANSKDSRGRSASRVASDSGHSNVASYLEEASTKGVHI